MKKCCFLIIASLLVFTACKKEFTIEVKSNNEDWGSVTGGGSYAKGTIVSIEAIAKEGYMFVEWQDNNTDNPRDIVADANVTYTATFADINAGANEPKPTFSYVFSTSADNKVYFSPGNLQWNATGTHTTAEGTAAGTWRFVPNQWDMIGSDNKNIAATYTDWIDLFGWGTSGYNNKYPYMTSTTVTDYGSGANNISGTNYDWGLYNAIVNPNTDTTYAPGTWRSLTSEEWSYLLNTRSDSGVMNSIRYAKATVHGVAGLVILPDKWNSATYHLNNPNSSSAAYSDNVINSTDWISLERSGAVFLPAAGHRAGTLPFDVGLYGRYWSATYNSSDYACHLHFTLNSLNHSRNYCRYCGLSVRLVKDVQ